MHEKLPANENDTSTLLNLSNTSSEIITVILKEKVIWPMASYKSQYKNKHLNGIRKSGQYIEVGVNKGLEISKRTQERKYAISQTNFCGKMHQ